LGTLGTRCDGEPRIILLCGPGGSGGAATVSAEEEEYECEYEERLFSAEYLITQAPEEGIITAIETQE
jgi:hypothetical protein